MGLRELDVVNCLNHIVSIQYKRGLQAEPSIPCEGSVRWSLRLELLWSAPLKILSSTLSVLLICQKLKKWKEMAYNCWFDLSFTLKGNVCVDDRFHKSWLQEPIFPFSCQQSCLSCLIHISLCVEISRFRTWAKFKGHAEKSCFAIN